MRLEKFIEVLLSIVIGKFLACFDVLDRIDLDLASGNARFAIGPTGMVDVSGGIVVTFSVDGPL